MIKSFDGAASSCLLFFLSMVSSSQDFVESTLIVDCNVDGSNNFLGINRVSLFWEPTRKVATLVTKRANVSPC